MLSWYDYDMEKIPTGGRSQENIFYDFPTLVRHLEGKYSSTIEATLEQQQEMARDVRDRDQAVADRELGGLFRAYGIEGGEADAFVVDEKGYIHREFIPTNVLPQLPSGYGFKGGAARYALHVALGLTPFPPRDFDIVRLEHFEPSSAADAGLAETYAPDDYAHGYGVEVVQDMDKYFKNRDVTINEILLFGTEIICTRQALMDTMRGILRPTECKRNEYNGVGPQILAKILRFYAESIVRFGHTISIEESDDMRFEEYFISPFWIALNLDRAYERGYSVAQKYVDVLGEKKQLPPEIDSPEKAVSYLEDLLEGDHFYFRNAPASQFDLEKSWVKSNTTDEELEDAQEQLETGIRKRV